MVLGVEANVFGFEESAQDRTHYRRTVGGRKLEPAKHAKDAKTDAVRMTAKRRRRRKKTADGAS